MTDIEHMRALRKNEPNLSLILQALAETGETPEKFCWLADYGRKVLAGTKKNRCDALNTLAIRTLKGLRQSGNEPTSREVILALDKYDDPDDLHTTFQEMVGREKMIYWIDKQGREQKTSFEAFRKRLYRLKNKDGIN